VSFEILAANAFTPAGLGSADDADKTEEVERVSLER